MSTIGDQALEAAAYQSANGPKFGVNQCMMRTRILYGAPAIGDYDGDGSADAEDGWKYASDKHPTTDPTSIPRGVPIWWGGGSHDNGHVALSAGDGMCWSTDIKRAGYYDLVPVDLIRQQWGLPLLGWTGDIDGVVATDATTPDPVKETPVTSFVVDGSHYQSGLTVAALKKQGYAAVWWKCTEGTSMADDTYADHLAQAKAAKMPFACYHFLHRGNGDKQAAWLAAHIIDKSVPVILDVEAGGKATWPDVTAFIAGCAKRGVTVAALYLPETYWAAIGKPPLAGYSIVQAAYPTSTHAYGSALYPGNNHPHWAPYGGTTPVLWQFASTAKIDGFPGSVDVSAFRGSPDQLATLGLFKTWGTPVKTGTDTTPTVQEDDDMPAFSDWSDKDKAALVDAVVDAPVVTAGNDKPRRLRAVIADNNNDLATLAAKVDALTAAVTALGDSGKAPGAAE